MTGGGRYRRIETPDGAAIDGAGGWRIWRQGAASSWGFGVRHAIAPLSAGRNYGTFLRGRGRRPSDPLA